MTPSVEVTDERPRTVGLFTDEGHRMLDALRSENARAILDELNDDPGTISDVTDRVDTSIQNVHYHVDQLEEAGLVRVVETHYSVCGNEMDVYAPNGKPLALVTSESARSRDGDQFADEARIEPKTVRSD